VIHKCPYSLIKSLDFIKSGNLLINRTENNLIFTISIPESYYTTYIQYALYDIDNNQLSDFKTLCGTPDPLLTTGTFTINDNFSGVCAIAFRLLRPCETESGSGGERTLVPVEDTGYGSAGSHWENNNRLSTYPGSDGFDYLGITYDVMTAFLQTANISNLSVAYLLDIGYSPDPGYVFDRCSWKDFVSTAIPNLSDVLDAAASAWEAKISYDASVFASIQGLTNNTGSGSGSDDSGSGSESGCGDGWNGLRLDSIVEYDAGPGFAAQCSVNDYIDLGGVKKNAISFSLVINTYYTGIAWTSVMIHELGHALGIGTLWQQSPDFWLSRDNYPLTSDAYNSNLPSDFEKKNNCIGNTTNNPTSNDDINAVFIEENCQLECGCNHQKYNYFNKPKSIGTFIKD
jgi:hypothetical protein